MTKWFNFIKKSQKKGKTDGRAAISFLHDGIALAYCLFDEKGACDIQFCEFYPYDDAGDKLKWLADIINSRELKDVPFSWVLLAQDYKLLMLEAPDIPAAERNDAMRWQIKEMIDFPLEEALLDTCLIPEFGPSRRRMLYAVVARQSQLLPKKALLQGAGIILEAIDIIELILRNIASLYVKPAQSIVLVSLSTADSLLTVCQDDNLYFSRNIKIDFATLSDDYISNACAGDEVPPAFDTLVTNIQRSLDYFESQMGKVLPESVVITPLPFRANTLKAYLTDNLSPTIILADLNDVLTTQQELTLELQAQCVPVLGGLLRDGDSDATTD